LEADGEEDAAEAIYRSTLMAAEVEQFYKFMPAPLYQLCLLELRRTPRDPAAIERAAGLHKRLAALALEQRDALWMSLSSLASAMILFEERKFDESEKALVVALTVARAHGLRQAIEDAEYWLRSHHVPGLVRALAVPPPGSSTSLAWGILPPPKARKAERYAREPHRVVDVEFRFSSDSDVRNVEWSAIGWRCDCRFFQEAGECSHIAAVSMMLASGIWPSRGVE